VEGVVGKAGQEIGGNQAKRQEANADADQQAGAHFQQKQAQRPFGQHRLVFFEVVADRLGNQWSRILQWHLFDVDDDAKVADLRELQSPAFQELLRIGVEIEVAVMKRRRIHRVEQLGQFDYAQFDLVDGWMGGWVDGWMGGWVDGWMGGWVDDFSSFQAPLAAAPYQLAASDSVCLMIVTGTLAA